MRTKTPQKVRKIVGDHGPMSIDQIHKYLPSQTKGYLRKLLSRLVYEKRMERVGLTLDNKRQFLFANPTEGEMFTLSNDLDLTPIGAQNKDVKVALIKQLIRDSGDINKDVLIGILRDYA